MVEYADKKAKETGMEFWLYDEDGCPSGGADCGTPDLSSTETKTP